MIDFVLDDLGSEAGEFLFLLLEAEVTEGDFDAGVAGGRTLAGQGQAAFGSFVGFGRFFCDDRVQHGNRDRADVDGDDAFLYTNHVGGEADAMVSMGGQRIQKILSDGYILACGRLGFLSEEQGVFDDFMDHGNASFHN